MLCAAAQDLRPARDEEAEPDRWCPLPAKGRLACSALPGFLRRQSSAARLRAQLRLRTGLAPASCMNQNHFGDPLSVRTPRAGTRLLPAQADGMRARWSTKTCVFPAAAAHERGFVPSRLSSDVSTQPHGRGLDATWGVRQLLFAGHSDGCLGSIELLSSQSRTNVSFSHGRRTSLRAAVSCTSGVATVTCAAGQSTL